LNDSRRDEIYENIAGYTWTDYKTNTDIAKELYNPSFGHNREEAVCDVST
jgi:hypothetical protein